MWQDVGIRGCPNFYKLPQKQPHQYCINSNQSGCFNVSIVATGFNYWSFVVIILSVSPHFHWQKSFATKKYDFFATKICKKMKSFARVSLTRCNGQYKITPMLTPFVKPRTGTQLTQLFSIGHCTIFCQCNSLKTVAKLFSQWKWGAPFCPVACLVDSRVYIICSFNFWSQLIGKIETTGVKKDLLQRKLKAPLVHQSYENEA